MARDPGHQQPGAQPLPFVTFDQIEVSTVRKRHIIKGIIALGETSAWVGPPGTLKSALLTDLAIATASGQPWRGKPSKAAAGVVYFALERADLVRRRLQAHRERDHIGRLPIAVVDQVINLMTPSTIPVLVATIRAIEAQLGERVGLLIFDTFAKTIAAGGGDEDRARDQGQVFANLQRLKQATGCHVALIGHTGKDPERGARGSNAILGDVDLMVMITGQQVRTATAEKNNDGPIGPLFSFAGEVHDFGPDEDGDPQTVLIIAADNLPTQAREKGKGRQLSPRQQLALDALSEAIIEHGQPAPNEKDYPRGAKVVTMDQWKAAMFSNGALEADASNPRADFQRVRQALAVRKMIGGRDALVWIARP